MSFYLGELPEKWNELARQDAPRGKVERTLNRELTREWMARITSSELRVLHFVYSRTLMWQKFAEAIPMSHFTRGVTDRAGALLRLSDGNVVCSGCGIKKEETVRAAVVGLCAKKLLSYIPGTPGSQVPANVYFCCPPEVLARRYLDAGGGILPCGFAMPGEHLCVENKYENVDAMYKVVRIKKDSVEVQKVDSRLRDTGPLVEWPNFDGARRPTLEEWMSFKQR